MHEVLITRGMVQKASPQVQFLIYTADNCVILHHGDCHVKAVEQKEKAKCVKQLVAFEGYTSVMDWLHKMQEQMNASLHEQKALVMNALAELLEGPTKGKTIAVWRFEP